MGSRADVSTWKDHLPQEVEKDMHQIMAKAMFLRMNRDRTTRVFQFTAEEMREAAEIEFEYDLADDGTFLFRQVTQ